MTRAVELQDVYWVDASRPAEASRRPRIDLEEALLSDRIEFWYQPKIDFKDRVLVGVEAFARLRLSDEAVVTAGALIEGASMASLVALSSRALESALMTSENLSEIGVDVRIAVNMSVDALLELPIVELVRKHRPAGGKCLGLVFDIPEEQALARIDDLARISAPLRACGFSVAVDDFGRALLTSANGETDEARIGRTFDALRRLKDLQFAEMKLDRTIVTGCDIDPRKRTICKCIIDLTHAFGSAAVAVGVENAAELRTLRQLSCDIGQGLLFGSPMSEESFLQVLWERSVRANDSNGAKIAQMLFR